MDVWLRDRDVVDGLLRRDRLGTRFGYEAADRITQRLQELVACENLLDAEGLPGGCHELRGSGGMIAVWVEQDLEVRLRPRPNPAPRRDDGSLDLAAIRDVIVVDIAVADS